MFLELVGVGLLVGIPGRAGLAGAPVALGGHCLFWLFGAGPARALPNGSLAPVRLSLAAQ